jgi:hypothetical protein
VQSDTAGSPGRGAPAQRPPARPAAIARRHGDPSADVRGIKGRARSKYDPPVHGRPSLPAASVAGAVFLRIISAVSACDMQGWAESVNMEPVLYGGLLF